MALINGYGDCASSGVKGSGKSNCDKSLWGELKGFGLFQKGTFFPITDGVADIDATKIKDAIKSASLFPYKGLNSYEDASNENTINTSDIQVEQTTQQGLPKINFMLASGYCTYNSIYDKRGFERWDLVLFYTKGIRFASNTAGTKLSGFDAGNVSVSTEKIAKGGDLQMSTTSIQLLDADEYNERSVFLSYSDLGVDLKEINGYVDVKPVFAVAPVAGTTYSLKVQGACNSSADLTANFEDVSLWKTTGTQATPASVTTVVLNATTGNLDITIDNATVATDTIGFKLSDGTVDVVEDVIGTLYSGSTKLATV